ncbi:MAG: MFS transporter [Patescibacteria group bacterium]
MSNAVSRGKFWRIYIGGFLLAGHYALVVYVNSSLLKQFVGDGGLGLLYALGSIFSIIVLSLAPFITRRFGNKKTLALFVLLESFAVIAIGNTELALLIFGLFILHQAAESILYLSLDLALEQETVQETTTGSKRGVFFTIQNLAWVLSPLVVSLLTRESDFSNIYILSGLMLLPLLILSLFLFKNHHGESSRGSDIMLGIKNLMREKDVFRIFVVQFILNFFYAWMVVYLPLLLNLELGFSWEKIGLLFTIMLLPFLLFQFPAGLLADKKWGEKELLIGGLLTMSLATILIPFINTESFVLWAIILFATRIGASLVEISGETYFFKHTKYTDSAVISLFRMTRPFSLLVAPLIAIPVLYFINYSYSFIFLSLVVALGLFFIPKVDTK